MAQRLRRLEQSRIFPHVDDETSRHDCPDRDAAASSGLPAGINSGRVYHLAWRHLCRANAPLCVVDRFRWMRVGRAALESRPGLARNRAGCGCVTPGGRKRLAEPTPAGPRHRRGRDSGRFAQRGGQPAGAGGARRRGLRGRPGRLAGALAAAYDHRGATRGAGRRRLPGGLARNPDRQPGGDAAGDLPLRAGGDPLGMAFGRLGRRTGRQLGRRPLVSADFGRGNLRRARSSRAHGGAGRRLAAGNAAASPPPGDSRGFSDPFGPDAVLALPLFCQGTGGGAARSAGKATGRSVRAARLVLGRRPAEPSALESPDPGRGLAACRGRCDAALDAVDWRAAGRRGGKPNRSGTGGRKPYEDEAEPAAGRSALANPFRK